MQEVCLWEGGLAREHHPPPFLSGLEAIPTTLPLYHSPGQRLEPGIPKLLQGPPSCLLKHGICSWASAAADPRETKGEAWEPRGWGVSGWAWEAMSCSQYFLLVCGSAEPRNLLVWVPDLLPSPQDSA